MADVKKGRFYQDSNVYQKLKNPDRYTGRVKQITSRSRWEKLYMLKFLDKDPRVIEWSSEDLVISYLYTVDGKPHRYFPDFWMKIHTKSGIKEYIVEIKPFVQCNEPKIPKKPAKVSKAYAKKLVTYRNAVLEYEKNQNKWEATEKFCEKVKKRNGTDISFQVITERELGI